MKRREFLEKAGVGSAALVTLATPVSSRTASKGAGQHNHTPLSGPLATATVSFGAWGSTIDPRIDRFPNRGQVPGLPNNIHALIPNEVTIKAGGTVNFIIAGFHLLLVYDDGTQPGDINTSNTIPSTIPPGPPLINDPTNRVYRGLDPTVLPFLQGPPQGAIQPVLQDRVEVVHFPNRGRYLVICGVLPHFVNDGMYGFVKVNP